MEREPTVIVYPDLIEIESTTQSFAELRVAKLLDRIDAPNAVAFHSVKLRSHPHKQQAEADFVILWKGVLVVVEVKGGGIQQHNGVWYSIDRNQDAHRLRESPMEQSRQAMYALRNILHEDGLAWFASEAIVITPDISAPPPSPEWEPSHWFDEDTMSQDRLVEALNLVARGARQPPRGQRRASVQDLRNRLHGEFLRFPELSAQSRAVVSQQMQATADQANMLSGLSGNQRIVVLGGAGTGKSVVLAEAAKQEASSDKSVLVTFLSPSLKSFFEDRVKGRGIRVADFSSIGPDEQFDVVLIDEAQDLMTAEDMDRIDSAVRGGRTNGRWRMFLDHNNQAHVDGAYDPEVFELVSSEAAVFELSKNVRNTKSIVFMVQEYLQADVGDPGIVNGAKVVWERFEGEHSRTRALEVAEEIASQSIDPVNIWIISVNGAPQSERVEGDIRILTPKEAKGLEAEHVVVCDLPSDYNAESLAAFYVAATRARVTLHIVLNKEDEHRLRHLVSQGKMVT